MLSTVQVRQRGNVTLPVDIRKRYNVQDGDTYRLIDVDGILILTPMSPMLPELAREIERARVEAGLSMEEMLQGLREQRAQYVAEKYGIKDVDPAQ